MVRPTIEGLAHTQDMLDVLAHQDEDTYHLFAFLADALVFALTEAEHARKAAAYGAGGPRSPLGGGEATGHTIGRHGLGRPVEDRLDWGAEQGRGQRGGTMQPPVEPADRLYKDLRAMHRHWTRRLDGLVRDVQAELEDKTYWPGRTDDQDDGLPRAGNG